jgi:hypothetical protein
MDQMAFNLNRAINEGYRAGKPVIVLSNVGKVPHGRRDLEACVRPGTVSPLQLFVGSRLRNGLRATGLRLWRRPAGSTIAQKTSC